MNGVTANRFRALPRHGVWQCHNDAVTDDSGDGSHVGEEQLGLHFLGELDVYRSDAVHRHLRHCGRCAAKAEEIVEVLAVLALGAEYDDEARRTG
jgi:hypothetical protein